MKHFVALEGFHLDSKEQDLKLLVDVKLTPTQEQSMKKTSESNQMETSDQLNLFPRILSVEDSHAKIYPLLTRTEKDLRASDLVFGGSSQELSKIAHLHGSSWKTYQHCFIQGLETFCDSFPRSGMMSNGIVYERATLGHPISEIGYGLWLTPTVTEISQRSDDAKQRRKKYRESIGRKTVPFGNLSEQVDGKLNPPWVEGLMGFPIGYTELNALETQSFLKSRNGLRKESKK